MVTSEDLENIGFEYPENGLPFFGKNHWIFEGSKHHMYNSTSSDEVLIFLMQIVKRANILVANFALFIDFALIRYK